MGSLGIHTFHETRTSPSFKGSFSHLQENQEEFFDKLITQDETTVYHYDPETKV